MTWNEFAAKYWEKKPVTFKSAKSELLSIDDEVIFDLLVQYASHCEHAGNPAGLKFYIDGERQPSEDVFSYLPQVSDRNFSGYHRRMAKEFSDYCLVCDELIRVMHHEWNKLGKFMSELHAVIGVPNRFSEIGLYLGNYQKTPFGVHVDKCGVISIPVVGEKTFRLWTPAYVEANPDLQEAHFYKNHLRSSTVQNIGVGDVSYWPSSHWHIAENPRQKFSCTWSIGVWIDKSAERVLLDAIATALKHEAQGSIICDLNASALRPADIETLVQDFQNLNVGLIQDLIEKDFLLRRSKFGFKERPFTLHEQGSTKNPSGKLKQKLRSLDPRRTKSTVNIPAEFSRGNSPILEWTYLKSSTKTRIGLAIRGQWLEFNVEDRNSHILKFVSAYNGGQRIVAKNFLGSDVKELVETLILLREVESL